jgi:MGT family glycosyltransferase
VDAKTVLFMPESAYGPTNNCIGVADVLRRRGHRVVFAAEASWGGRLSPLGFEEALVDLAPPSAAGEPENAGQFWKEFIAQTAPEFRKPTIEQLETFMEPTWQALTGGARYCEQQLREMLAAISPDVVVEDNVVTFPALLTCGAPYVRIVSCNPLEVPDPGLPPAYSGLPTDDRSQWQEFKAEYDRTHRPLWESFDSWVQQQGAPALPELQFLGPSPHLNLYVYPEALDYQRTLPLGASWHRLESCVRRTDGGYEPPPGLLERPSDSGLVYLSLGSLGSADTDLMTRLIDVLAGTRHRFIVSLGPQAAALQLADNMAGAEFLPQTSVLPLVDLVITHGGNNTVTEALHFGKPMIVLPLFWDQSDNAQRLDETGYGVRLDTYRFSDLDLTRAIDRLLADTSLAHRLGKVGTDVRAGRGVENAATHIEAIATP